MKGFTLIEALVAMSVIMMLVMTIIPIDIIIKQERSVLHDRRLIVSMLHDKLQQIIWENNTINSSSETVNNKMVTFEYNNEGEFIKGCASWENAKQARETICLYGY